jgi:hypothetical protein
MTRYVISPDVAVRLAHDHAVIRGEHQILAPAPRRSPGVLAFLPGSTPRRDDQEGCRATAQLRARAADPAWGTASCRRLHGRPVMSTQWPMHSTGPMSGCMIWPGAFRERIAGRMSLLQPGAGVLGGIGSNSVLQPLDREIRRAVRVCDIVGIGIGIGMAFGLHPWRFPALNLWCAARSMCGSVPPSRTSPKASTPSQSTGTHHRRGLPGLRRPL